jgi:hypothetical protein
MMASFSGEKVRGCGGCATATAMGSATANQPLLKTGKKHRSGSVSGFWLVTITFSKLSAKEKA